MRRLLLLALALAGCVGEAGVEERHRVISRPRSDCFRLETCEVHLGRESRVVALCVAGFDSVGARTGEVHSFLDRQMLESWSQLNPTAKVCP